MGRLRGDFGKSGYDSEEAYFHDVNQQLIRARRKKAAAPSRDGSSTGKGGDSGSDAKVFMEDEADWNLKKAA